MSVVFREFWPYHNLTLRALRSAYQEHRPEDDQPAALGMVVDESGMVHPGPLTIEDVLIVASRAFDDEALG